ncbi:beta-galactosidase 13-like [Musa acuminata AAA Group]|uniref:beta-galactosidase 13-like n=1 Tax=Musa acuminata AAA Group TaxID=214697 RepID=UPI0031D7C98F
MEISKCCLLLLVASSLYYIVCSTTVSHDGRALVIDGQRRVIFSGSIHYPRSTPEMWPDLIRKSKEGGLDAIETYVFWNGHEPRRREYNFEGNYDLIRFLKEVQNAGLYAILRIGPYVCAEWNYGGLPVWLYKIPGMQTRTDNQPWKDEMQNFTTLIVDKVKEERLLATQGGPIILLQIENEYGNGDIERQYGEAGPRYINWCANMAESLVSDVPWIMCQQSDAPQPMINTCNGFSGCDGFTPNNGNSPKIWTENWTGWFKNWGSPDPHRPVEEVAFQVARFFQSKGTVQNYYMYHGGTNFGRTSGGPYIVTSYDYDAPLDEYGNIRQPKWGHLKELHASVKLMEKALTYGEVVEDHLGNGLTITKFSGDGIVPGCFLSNQNSTVDATISFQGTKYFLPAWSVSILPDCKKEVYNTAKVKTQTSIMVKKKDNAGDQSKDLRWSWKPERLHNSAKGFGSSFTVNKLLEQKTTTVDASDYLWYTTNVEVSKKESFTLSVNTTGHILYAFVNGRLVGSEYATGGSYNFIFERNVTFKPGKNQISLLSATVGLRNYGAFYDNTPVGIVGGPVKLIGKNNTILDLSESNWSYKIGLDGEVRKLQLDEKRWHSGVIPTNRPFTWYKTTFQAPLGSEPVVVDLLGLGKGEAWVNGNSLGRFWPNFTANPYGCNQCDYRGNFQPNKCQTACGEASQRWYHVPRSFLKRGEPNTLTLFEEAGGNPNQVNFQTVTVGTACASASASEGDVLSLSCQGGRTISSVDFATFGEPDGTCGAYVSGGCVSHEAVAILKDACLGRDSCSIQISDKIGTSCAKLASPRKLVVQVTCS